jgi:hypothetical protein
MKKLAAGVLAFRIAYGAALLIAPGKVAGNRWLGPGAHQPAATVALRGLGGREVAVHGIALALLSRDGLPSGSPAATAAVAGGSAALTAAVAASLDA